MRPVSFERDFVKHPAGAVLASYGDTRVLCTACLEDGVPRFREGKGGWVTAEYAMLPGSTHTRKRRAGAKKDGRSVEIQRLIGRSLRAAVRLDRLGDNSIWIDCDVLQADGGTRTAAISGAWVALYDALTILAKKQQVADPAWYLQGQLAAVSVGIVDGAVICDLDYKHDSRAEVDMNVVMRGEDFVEVQGTGEAGVFSRAQMDQLLDSAGAGIKTIMAAQRAALGLA
jgi:ribonuclease PH